jgi:hypothetical protein
MQRNDINTKTDLTEDETTTTSVGGSNAGIKGDPPVKSLGYKKDNERLQKTTMSKLKEILKSNQI